MTRPCTFGSPFHFTLSTLLQSYNGGAVVAMVGKECVAIASDRRFGVQAMTLNCDFQKLFPMGDRLYIGLAGLATDVQTLYVRGIGVFKDARSSLPYCNTKYGQ